MWLVDAWYRGAWWLQLLRPLSWLFNVLAAARRRRLTAQQCKSALPVIIVGNLTVGGAGKTPVVLALGSALRQQGWRVGVLSRGYGGQSRHYPLFVKADTDVRASGDEARMLRRHHRGPLVVDPDRCRGLHALEESGLCDVVVCDDGLQHYRLGRDIEVVVVDAERGFGNGLTLPAGPLREPAQRLAGVDVIVLNGRQAEAQLAKTLEQQSTPIGSVQLQPAAWINVKTGQRVSLQNFQMVNFSEEDEKRQVYAIAGIGHPQRFFDSLAAMGIDAHCEGFPDHHAYRAADLSFADSDLLLMTEKDAVKCERFAQDNWWYLAIEPQLDNDVLTAVINRLNTIRSTSANMGDKEHG